VTLGGLAAFAAGWLIAPRNRGGFARRPRTVSLRGTPDGRRRPSDGLVAEASIVARLLRLRLLTLDATVVVAPADVTAARARHARSAHDAPASSARPTAAHSTVPPATAPPARPIGRRLAQAARLLDESAATLAATRRP
jgi:hypothetical protein